MESFDIVNILTVLATPVTGILSYSAGKRKRNNDFLQDLQKSVNMLSEKNSELLNELVTVKQQNVQLQVAVTRLQIENTNLLKQVQDLHQQLENVRVITKIEKKQNNV